MSHWHWLKSGVCRALHVIPSSCAHDVVVLILCTTLPSTLCCPSSPSSSFSFSCSSPSSSMMWVTRTLRTLASEDLGTLAENDPLTDMEVCSNQGFLPGLWKNTRNKSHGETWCRNDVFMVLWHGRSCKEMRGKYCQLAKKMTQQLYKVATPCMDDHQLREEEIESVGELSTVSSQIVLKCLYVAHIGRPDILWSVNKLARAVTKWTKACDKRLARLISCIHHTCEYWQYCYVGDTAQQCWLGLFSRLWFCRRRWETRSQQQEEFCAFSEAEHLCQKVGCARNKPQFHTVLRKLK